MHIIEHPSIPFSSPIYEGFPHNGTVDIHGSVHHGYENGFVVEFPSKHGIAFHMSIRMGSHGGEHCIVLNSLHHGHWQHEERYHNPIHFGEHFNLHISNHHGHYSIHINHCHLAHFHHRESPHHIHALAIRGNIHVSKIHFEHFHHHNGGGIQVGGSVTPMYISPTPVYMPPPPPPAPVIIAPAPPIIAAPQVVVVEEEDHHHHHHHHHHGLLHHLFHHRHHDC